MNTYKRVLSLVCVVLVLSSAFCITANASFSDEQISNNLNYRAYIQHTNQGACTSYYNLGEQTYYESSMEYIWNNYTTPNFAWYDIFDFVGDSGGISDPYYFYGSNVIVSKGDSFSIDINDVNFTVLNYINGGLNYAYPLDTSAFKKCYFQLFDRAGNSKYVDVSNVTISDTIIYNTNFEGYGRYNLSVSLDSVPFDVTGIRVITEFDFSKLNGRYSTTERFTSEKSYVKNNNAKQYRMIGSTGDINFTIEEEEKGILKSIISWLSNIKDNITGGFSNVVSNLSNGFNNMVTKLNNLWDSITNGFANVIQNIIQLPQKIWTFIRDGLKELFIPDEEYMTGYRDSWDSLLSARLGAVYQVGSYMGDFFGSFSPTDNKQGFIEFPKVDFEIIDGEVFSFGGWQVDVVPDGFEFAIDTLKVISGVVMTFLFCQGLLRRYDEVMGVER